MEGAKRPIQASVKNAVSITKAVSCTTRFLIYQRGIALLGLYTQKTGMEYVPFKHIVLYDLLR